MVGDLVRTMVARGGAADVTEGGDDVAPRRSERFHKAAATLRQVYSEIDVILDPVPEDIASARRRPTRFPAPANGSTNGSKLARGMSAVTWSAT